MIRHVVLGYFAMITKMQKKNNATSPKAHHVRKQQKHEDEIPSGCRIVENSTRTKL